MTSHAIHPQGRLGSLAVDEKSRDVAAPDDIPGAGLFRPELNHLPLHLYGFEINNFCQPNHQLEADYALDSESSRVNTALIPQDPLSALDDIRSSEYTLQHIPIPNIPPPGYPHPAATEHMLAGMVPAPEPPHSPYNSSYIPANPTDPGLEPTDAPHHQFCALLIERNINPYDFISFMLAHRHLDADRLRALLSGLAGRRVPSRRHREIRREARICSECGTKETKQWRHDPSTKADLCNPCGQHAYRTRMGGSNSA